MRLRADEGRPDEKSGLRNTHRTQGTHCDAPAVTPLACHSLSRRLSGHTSTIKRRITMNVVCLDMEGVLVPEIWIAFAEASGSPS